MWRAGSSIRISRGDPHSAVDATYGATLHAGTSAVGHARIEITRMRARVLFCVVFHWAAQHVAAALPDQHASFSTCDTGTSRLQLANAAHLPLQCKPGHNDLAAAVLDCFSNCRVVVHNCRVSLYPRPSSKSGFNCRSMHAQGSLTGPTNTSLVAVLDSSRAAVALLNSSATFKGLTNAGLQNGMVKALHMLFDEVVVQRNGSASSTGSSRSSSTKSSRRKRDHDVGAGASTPPSAISAQLQQQNNSAAASIPAQGDASLGMPLHVKHVQRVNATSSTSGGLHQQDSSSMNSSSSSPVINSTASLLKDTHSDTPSVLPAGTASTAANASSTAAQHGRHLLKSWQQPQSQDATGCVVGDCLDHTLPFVRSVAALARMLAALGTPASESPVDPGPRSKRTRDKANGTPVDSAGAMAGASAKSLRGAVLFRQGSSIVLQPSSGCQYQFMVTRNSRLLQPDEKLAARAGPAAAAGHRHHKQNHSWWVSAAALFTAVSAILAIAVCYMSVQIWRRYKSYEMLPSEPTDGGGQQAGVRSITSADGLNATAVGASAWSPAEMSLEMQRTGTKSGMQQRQEGRDMTSLDDQVHP